METPHQQVGVARAYPKVRCRKRWCIVVSYDHVVTYQSHEGITWCQIEVVKGTAGGKASQPAVANSAEIA
jgi:hypothetical protein